MEFLDPSKSREEATLTKALDLLGQAVAVLSQAQGSTACSEMGNSVKLVSQRYQQTLGRLRAQTGRPSDPRGGETR